MLCITDVSTDFFGIVLTTIALTSVVHFFLLIIILYISLLLKLNERRVIFLSLKPGTDYLRAIT